MSQSPMNSKPHYEQLGVAMTCRSYAEYERMFNLTPELLHSGPILDVAAGASSFAADASRQGASVRAADPLYSMTTEEIRVHGELEIRVSTEKLDRLKEHFDWSYYGSIDLHRAQREASLERFTDDYRLSGGSGKYISATLPDLPLEENAFSLVLCSHFLFLYAEQFDYDFHLSALRELIRVCRPGGQVRIYPIFSLKYERYEELDRLMQELGDEAEAVLEPAKLPFIPGSGELLKLQKYA